MIRQTLLATTLILSSSIALAQRAVDYEVTITNITRGQTFTPQLVVTHPANVQLFELGGIASEPLEILAEGGDTQPLTLELTNVAQDVQTIGGLLAPGASASIMVSGNPGRDHISVAAMLIPTNDTFMALNNVPLPKKGSAIFQVPGYDSGTEENDQSCANIPGPRCPGGVGYVPGGGEGYIYIGNGFHELGAAGEGEAEILGPLVYDWRNSVAQVTVSRMN
jgi:Spondin_N